MFRILGIIVIVILGLIGLTFVANKGGHEGYKTEYFKPGPVIGMLKGLSDDELGGREIGSDGSLRAREMIKSRLEALDLMKMGNSYIHPFDSRIPDMRERQGREVSGANLIAAIQGTSGSDQVIVLTAHYDHVGVDDEGQIYNGADDNASGVAALLAVAEHFTRKKSPPQHTLVLVFFDGEERGMLGAQEFVDNPGLPPGTMAFNLNLDMVSRADNGKLWASGVSRTPSLRPIIETVNAETPIDLNIGYDGANPDQDDWTMQSDHREFVRAGIPHLYLGVEDHPDYHRPTDDFENVDQDTFLKTVDTIIALVTAIDADLDLAVSGFDPGWKPAPRERPAPPAEETPELAEAE